MVQKCPHCNNNISRFPIKKQPDKTLKENFDERTINWRNLFKIDIFSVIFFFTLLAVILGYQLDIQKCEVVINDPCEFCEYNGCCSQPLYCYEDATNIKPIPNTFYPGS